MRSEEQAAAERAAGPQLETTAQRHAAAGALRGAGEAAVARGDFNAALAAFDRGLAALRPPSQVGDADATLGSVVGGEAALEATSRLRATLFEARAQVLMLLPAYDAEDPEAPSSPRRSGRGTLEQAARAAEAAVAAAAEWAPGWLTLGRAMLALRDPERARAALARAASLDGAFFQAEGGALDLEDATRLLVRACVNEAAAEVAAQGRHVGLETVDSCNVGAINNEADSEEAVQDVKRWRVHIVDGQPVIVD